VENQHWQTGLRSFASTEQKQKPPFLELPGGYDQYTELYEDIATDADRQLRALSNRFRKLAIYAERAAEKSVAAAVDAIEEDDE